MRALLIIIALGYSLTSFGQEDGTIKVRKPGCDVEVVVKVRSSRTSYETYIEQRFEYDIVPKDYNFASLTILDSKGNSVYAKPGIRHTYYINRFGNGPSVPAGTYTWTFDMIDECGKAHQKTGTFEVINYNAD